MIIKYLVIIVVIAVLMISIIVSSTRAENIGMYNYDVMKRNGDTLRIEATSVLDLLVGEINRGAIMRLPKKNNFTKDATLNDNRIYLIDFQHTNQFKLSHYR